MGLGWQRAFFQQTCYLFVTWEQLSFASRARGDVLPLSGGAFGEPEEGWDGLVGLGGATIGATLLDCPVSWLWMALVMRRSGAAWVDNPSVSGGMEESMKY